MPADTGQIQLTQPRSQICMYPNTVLEPLARFRVLDGVLQNVEDLIRLRIDPRIVRPVLADDGQRTAASAPSTLAATRLVWSKTSLEIEKIKGRDGEADAKFRDGKCRDEIPILTSHGAVGRPVRSGSIP